MWPPLVERELRVALFRSNARGQWLRSARISGGITLFCLFILNFATHWRTGRTLFVILFGLACIGIIRNGFGLTADLLSEERRNGTLGLLVLTGLTPLEIFLHKLTGAVLLSAYGLLGVVPFFAVSLLAGGISGTQIVCALVFLANGLLFCVAVGLLGSVLHREAGSAQAISLIIASVLNLAGPLLYRGLGLFSPLCLISSPAYGGYLILGGFSRGSLRLFWIGNLFTLAYSLVALSLAAIVLHRTWRDEPAPIAPKKWRDWWQNRLLGSYPARRHLRARLLETNAFCWLAARDRRSVLAGTIFTAFVAAVWLGGWALTGDQWIHPGIGVVTAVILHFGLNCVIAYAAAKPFGEERQSGGFELLLTTPLTPSDLVEAQNRGLLVQFKGLFLGVLLLDTIFACTGLLGGEWDMWLAGVYLATWGAFVLLWFAVHLNVACRAMWISLWTGRPGYAAMSAMKPNFWLLLGLLWCGSGIGASLNSPAGWAVLTFFLVLIAMAVFQSRRLLREKLTAELAHIVRAPVPVRGDKRFKKWNPKAIYPPPLYLD